MHVLPLTPDLVPPGCISALDQFFWLDVIISCLTQQPAGVASRLFRQFQNNTSTVLAVLMNCNRIIYKQL